jgi:Trk K+ transport system NAD-binding subunit
MTTRHEPTSQNRWSRGDQSPATDENSYYVLGGEHVGLAVARRLQAEGCPVTVVDESHEPGELPGIQGDPTDLQVLTEAGIGDTSTVVVATHSDRRNFLVAQLVRAHFDVPRTVVLTHDPDRFTLLAEAGHEPFCVSTALSEALSEVV